MLKNRNVPGNKTLKVKGIETYQVRCSTYLWKKNPSEAGLHIPACTSMYNTVRDNICRKSSQDQKRQMERAFLPGDDINFFGAELEVVHPFDKFVSAADWDFIVEQCCWRYHGGSLDPSHERILKEQQIGDQSQLKSSF